MLKLRIISFFLSLLIAMQMLPVSQIGQALSQNQWNEELPHSHDDACKGGAFGGLNHPYLPPHDYVVISSNYAENIVSAYIHFSEQIPSNHSTEVVSPPPDVVI